MKFNRLKKAQPRTFLVLALFALIIGLARLSEPASEAQSKRTNIQEIQEVGNVREELDTAENLGELDANTAMDMTVSFNVQNRADLDQFITQLHNPNSSAYHQWLTPEQFGDRFGIPSDQYEKMAKWLTAQGFEVTQRWPNRLQLGFRGNAGQVKSAFETKINRYRDGNEIRFANERKPKFPAEFINSISHVRGLENFSEVKPASQQPEPQFQGGGTIAMAPKDLQKVYNLDPVIASGIDGSGQQIGIVARSNYHKKDVAAFRTRFGLPAKAPKKIFPFGKIKNRGGGEEVEVLLDAQWAGAAAPLADINVVIAPDVDQSLEYIINKMPEVKIISMSFGLCEKKLGQSNTNFFHDLYTQAAAQGQTVFVSTGDNGVNDCGDRLGAQVNGLATSPNCVAVGGTSLDPRYDDNGNALYLAGEKVWRGGGGGTSIIFTKPDFQQSISGVAEDNFRSIPDVSQLADPGAPGAWIARKGQPVCCIGGTSLASPIWASFLALVTQKAGAQGNFNFKLYQMGNAQLTGELPAVFNDTVTGDNGINGITGFSAVTGYDRASGWGSFNGQQFIDNVK